MTDEIVSEQIEDSNDSPKMVTMEAEKLNQMIRGKQADAAAKERKRLEQEHQAKLAELGQMTNQSSAAQAEPAQPMQQNAPQNVDEIYQQISERLHNDIQQKMQQNAMNDQLNTIARNYTNHMATGKTKYEDFDEVTKDYPPEAFPGLTILLSEMPNAPDILYELMKTPEKIAVMNDLAQSAPELAKRGLAKLSDSVAQNQKALEDAKNQQAPTPMERMQSASVSNSNTGGQSIRELRNQSWLRG